jgi:hypothetical protein
MSDRIRIEIRYEYIDKHLGASANIKGKKTRIYGGPCSSPDNAIACLARFLRSHAAEEIAQADAIEAGNYEVME